MDIWWLIDAMLPIVGMIYIGENKDVKYKILFMEVSFYENDDEEINRIYNLDCKLFLKLK